MGGVYVCGLCVCVLCGLCVCVCSFCSVCVLLLWCVCVCVSLYVVCTQAATTFHLQFSVAVVFITLSVIVRA